MPELEGAETPPSEVGDQARTPGEVKGLAELEGAEAGNSGEDWSPVCRRTSSHTAGRADPPKYRRMKRSKRASPPAMVGLGRPPGEDTGMCCTSATHP